MSSEYTHQVIAMKRGVTRNSSSPMWRCTCSSNDAVFVFQHDIPERNSFNLFELAGYGPEMLDMSIDDSITWNNHPINVRMVKDGQYWKVFTVATRPEGAQPDPQYPPDPALYRQAAVQQAQRLLRSSDTVFWDTETTGTTPDDEIISIAIYADDGTELLRSFIKPSDTQRAAASEHVHGISPELLETAPTFEDLYFDIFNSLAAGIWVTYNLEFDTSMLDQMCRRNGLAPIPPLATADAMEITAKFFGELKPGSLRFTSKSLQFAAEHFCLDFPDAHDASADARMMIDVLRSIANCQPDGLPADDSDIPW